MANYSSKLIWFFLVRLNIYLDQTSNYRGKSIQYCHVFFFFQTGGEVPIHSEKYVLTNSRTAYSIIASEELQENNELETG